MLQQLHQQVQYQQQELQKFQQQNPGNHQSQPLQCIRKGINRKILGQTSGNRFIKNNNITTEKLSKDGLHLTNSGKGIIINNFVQSLKSSHFLTKQPNRQILSKFLKGRMSWTTKVMNLFRQFYVIANLNLNPVQITVSKNSNFTDAKVSI